MLLRAASADDADLFLTALTGAVNWDPEAPRLSRKRVMANPDLAHYLPQLSARGDFGVVAEDPDSGGVGAAWARYFSGDDPGYGYVSAEAPEITVWVAPEWRGRGVARALLQALIEEARRRRVHGLSLSVDAHNVARRLYAELGFRMVGMNATSETMLLPLR